jgi:hypothetical protein
MGACFLISFRFLEISQLFGDCLFECMQDEDV